MRDNHQEDWLTQARRGVLELCVLSLVSRSPQYGYQLVSSLDRWDQLAAPDGTMYPLLRRLERGGHLATRWQEGGAGPPRKYYSLTTSGRRLLQRMSTEWAGLARAVAEVQREEVKEAHG